MTPAEELRAAAAKLREMAAVATPGPFDVGPQALAFARSILRGTP